MFSKKPKSEQIENLSDKEKKTARENDTDRVQESLDKFIELDDQARDMVRDYCPKIKVEKANGLSFIKFGDQEFVAQHCSHIEVKGVGEPPQTKFNASYSSVYTTVHPAMNAELAAVMVSGREIKFVCNRHAVDILLEALRAAHKKALKD